MSALRTAWRLLSPRERRRAALTLAVVSVMALFDTLGTVSIMPFLAVLANPGLIASNHILSWLHDGLGFTRDREFLIFLGLCSFGLLVLAALVRTLGQIWINRFSQRLLHGIGGRLFETYLRRPYAFFLDRHSGDLTKTLLSEVTILIAQFFVPATTLVAHSVLALVLLGLLVAVNPMVAISGMVVLGALYGLLFVVIRRYLGRIGQQRVAANKALFRVVSEGLGGIKTTRLLAREQLYVDRFSKAARDFADSQAISASLGKVPKYAIEAVTFGGIILLTLVLMFGQAHAGSEALAHVLPLLGLYAFAGYRLLPAMQGIYFSLTALRFSGPVVESIAADLADSDALAPLPGQPAPALPFHSRIELREIGFSYASADRPSIEGISLTLAAGSTLGIVGTTGAGKTTLVDLLLGLLTPDHGQILIDDTPVTAANLRAWQAGLGYVPQDIFLADASVAENIAFGLPSGAIDRARVVECARLAQLSDFIESDLPQGYDTWVGERGVRLSGGQRQRIGIARALYHDPAILVFDEATSALDNLTEQEVVRAIGGLGGTKTIILIAHRISTVMGCTQILFLDHGRVAGLGSYDTLYRDNPAFRHLVDAHDET